MFSQKIHLCDSRHCLISRFVQAKAKKIDAALESYQAALELDPDSIEVKNNIELLWQGSGQGEGEAILKIKMKTKRVRAKATHR